MKKFYTPLFILTILSCSPKIRYVGSKYAPIDKVDVYVDASAIMKPYIIVAKGYPGFSFMVSIANQEKILKKAILKAKQYGADAVFLRDYYVQTNGTSITTTIATDSIIRTGTSNTSIQPNQGYINNEILFLKYK